MESGLVVLDEVMDQWELKVADWDGCEPIGSTEFDPETGQSVYADIDGVLILLPFRRFDFFLCY